MRRKPVAGFYTTCTETHRLGFLRAYSTLDGRLWLAEISGRLLDVEWMLRQRKDI